MRRSSLKEPTSIDARRAAAKASLRRDWELARKSSADKITDAEIDAEIDQVRTARWEKLHPPASR